MAHLQNLDSLLNSLIFRIVFEKCIAILNVEEPREDELAQIRWDIEGNHNPKYDSKTQIIHNLKDEKVYEINFTAYIEGKPENAANAMLVFDEDEKRYSEIGFKKCNK